MAGAVAHDFNNLLTIISGYARMGLDDLPARDELRESLNLAPEIFRGRKVNVEVECSSPLTLGMTVVDWWGVTGKAPNVTFLREIDADAYFDLIVDRLARL